MNRKCCEKKKKVEPKELPSSFRKQSHSKAILFTWTELRSDNCLSVATSEPHRGKVSPINFYQYMNTNQWLMGPFRIPVVRQTDIELGNTVPIGILRIEIIVVQ